jgi:hypothetical protein
MDPKQHSLQVSLSGHFENTPENKIHHASQILYGLQ